MSRGEEIKAGMNLLVQEREKQKHLDALKRDTLRKADFLIKKTVIEYQEVYRLIREFFMEFLEKRYEFTINELRKELKKVYISNNTRPLINNILDVLEASEYATVHYSKEDLIKILTSFKEAVEQLVRVHTSKKSILQRVMELFGREPTPETIISELPVIEGADAQHVRIYTLVEKCYIALDKHNMRKAKAAYAVLLQEYELLDEGHKAKHYPVIHQTYLDILSRAKMQR